MRQRNLTFMNKLAITIVYGIVFIMLSLYTKHAIKESLIMLGIIVVLVSIAQRNIKNE
jgi:hypothetical protein